MRRLNWMLAPCLALLVLNAHAQSLPQSSGWHTWRVAALDDKADSCCYSWQYDRGVRGGACRLGEHGLEHADLAPAVGMAPGRNSGDVQIFARLEQGRIVDARALNTSCPVDVDVELEDLGSIDAQVSLSWLESAWREHGSDADLLHVVARHAGGDEALIELAEDQNLEESKRKGALFWLAESASDRAVTWFDELLND